MPKNPKTPPLADWRVSFTDLAISLPQVVRASTMHTDGGWLHLRDTHGGILFACPAQHVAHVRRMEPGEVTGVSEKETAPAPGTRGGYRGGLPASEVAPPSRVPSGSMLPPPVALDSAAAGKVTPAARPRGGRRGK
jgi:hypothetical protein